jgi:hypothetical protein
MMNAILTLQGSELHTGSLIIPSDNHSVEPLILKDPTIRQHIQGSVHAIHLRFITASNLSIKLPPKLIACPLLNALIPCHV